MIEHSNIELSFDEVAWDFVEIFNGLGVGQINEMLIKNIPLEQIQFFNQYANQFAEEADIGDPARLSLPNLMLIGYLLRVLEERLLPDPDNQEITS